MSLENFAIFILTHGRADNVITVQTLKRCGYTGKYYIVIDDEDDQEDQYRKNFGDLVIQFNKTEAAKMFDPMDLSEDRRTIVYARNACFGIARNLGVRYFLELDDDYRSFEMRWVDGQKLMVKSVPDMDAVCEAMVDFLKATQADTVAMAQGGDFIGGANGGGYKKHVMRKAMNSFFCDAEKPFTFIGRINEDVNTYVRAAITGRKMFTVTDVSLTQEKTQSNKGGMSDVYLDMGTYLKSFYTVMVAPSCVKVQMMGDKHKRIHHQIKWRNCAPMILNERWKKSSDE